MSVPWSLNFEPVSGDLREQALRRAFNPNDPLSYQKSVVELLAMIAENVAPMEQRQNVILNALAVSGKQVAVIPFAFNLIIGSFTSGTLGIFLGGVESAQPDFVFGATSNPQQIVLPKNNQKNILLKNIHATNALSGTVHFCRI